MPGAVRPGVRGNAGIVATFKLGAAAALAYDGDIRAFKIGSEDKDDADLTFAEALSGETKDFKVTVTALQSTDSTSFWRLVWDNPGAEFTVVYGPHGNAVATAAKPHFLMVLKATGRPEIGGEAARGKGQRYTFDYEFEVVDGPTLATA